ncbi:hypothetical protein ScPMuIL_018182 [Solemya velum]
MEAENKSNPTHLSQDGLKRLTRLFDDGRPIEFSTMKRSLTLVASEPWLARRDKAPLLLHSRYKTLYLDNCESDMTETKAREHFPREELMRHESRDLKQDASHFTKDFKNGTDGHENSFGGIPIDFETAMELRKIVLGSTIHVYSQDWRQSILDFYDLVGPFPYGLQTIRCGSRALTLCIQAYFLKHLIFGREYQSIQQAQNSLKPSEFERNRALARAMSDILWRAGERQRAYVCLRQDKRIIGPSNAYRDDDITEKIYIHVFTKFMDLEMFIKRHLAHFSEAKNGGCILFLYSLILSRTIQRIHEDMDSCSEKLLTDNEDSTPALVNLLLTGVATKMLHNGDTIYDEHGRLLTKALRGVKERGQIGYLYWDKNEADDNRTEVGSMLKVPKLPIWVTQVNKQFGLLFSTNIDLIRDWRTEHNFNLHYYTGLSSHGPTRLTIETRIGRQMRSKTQMAKKEELNRIPPLEHCIMTKWYGAEISWNGTIPFV